MVEPTHLKKYARQNGCIFPNFRGENSKKYLKPPKKKKRTFCIVSWIPPKKLAPICFDPVGFIYGISLWSWIISRSPNPQTVDCGLPPLADLGSSPRFPWENGNFWCQIFVFRKRLYTVSSWWGETPKKSEKIWGQVKLDHFPQKKLGWKFSKIFEVSGTSEEDLRPMCTSSFSTINLDHLQERAAKFLKKNVRKSWSYYLCGPQKPSYVSRMK